MSLDHMTPQQCPAGKHPDWAIDDEHSHRCPWCLLEKRDEAYYRVFELLRYHNERSCSDTDKRRLHAFLVENDPVVAAQFNLLEALAAGGPGKEITKREVEALQAFVARGPVGAP